MNKILNLQKMQANKDIVLCAKSSASILCIFLSYLSVVNCQNS